jgi:hypothetical protein
VFDAHYRFVTNWRVPNTTKAAVADVIEDLSSLPDWWPAVYLEVKSIKKGAAHGAGGIAQLHTKGWLPYHLHWQIEIPNVDYPNRIEVRAVGDLTGRGLWQFAQDGDDVTVRYDWEVDAGKPLLRYGSPILRPIFAANHRWAMACGEISLKREILRRQALRDGRPFNAPPPPGPTFVRASRSSRST